jgi:hypothetical protein
MVTYLVFNSEDYSCVICWLEMMFWHNLQIKITTEAEHTLRTDSTFCGDMDIWEHETGVLYQVAVYGELGKLTVGPL